MNSDITYKLSPFTVLCGFICELCKHLCKELLVLLWHMKNGVQKSNTKMDKIRGNVFVI